MLYIKELYFKIIFLAVSCIFVFIILYFNKFNLIWLITSPLLYYLKKTLFSGIFIYTHPIELFNVIFNLILYFTLIIMFPYMIWLIIDFFKAGLFSYEYLFIKNQILIIIFINTLLNIIGFSFFLPSIWVFFESFNTNNIDDIKILMEIKIQDYFYFLFNYMSTLNFINLIICFYLYFIFYLTNLTLKNKKILITLNILFATIISPPEFIFQLVLFIIFLLFSESLLILFLLYRIFNKVTN